MTKNKIIIVGSGLIGRLMALYLGRQHFDVHLYDQADKIGTGSAARAAGGMLTPFSESLIAEPQIVKMGLQGITLWPEILATLDAYNYFQQLGSLVVSHTQDVGDMQRFVRHIETHWPQCDMQKINREQLAKLEPELARRFNSAVYLPQEGQIGNRKLMAALTHQLEVENISWHLNSKINCVSAHQIESNGQLLTADLVIDCRGTGAQSDIKNLRGVRGELFQLFAPEVNITRPVRLMHPHYHLYIAPKPNKHYVVGATEIESDDAGPMTVRSALELLSAAYSVHPGFAEAQIREQVSACRPALADNCPAIYSQTGLIQINGLYRHGFLLAPVVLQQALAAVTGHFNRINLAELTQQNPLIKQVS
jgi:glycine oxidase